MALIIYVCYPVTLLFFFNHINLKNNNKFMKDFPTARVEYEPGNIHNHEERKLKNRWLDNQWRVPYIH